MNLQREARRSVHQGRNPQGRAAPQLGGGVLRVGWVTARPWGQQGRAKKASSGPGGPGSPPRFSSSPESATGRRVGQAHQGRFPYPAAWTSPKVLTDQTEAFGADPHISFSLENPLVTHLTSALACHYPTPVLLPGKSHGRRSLVGCSPWCC